MTYQPNQPGYRPNQAAPMAGPGPAGPGARGITSNNKLITKLVYVVMGVILGGVWLASSGESLISHVWHDLAVLVVLLIVLRSRLRKRQDLPGARPMPQLSFGWIIGAKLVLLIVAAGAEWLLQRAGVARTDLIVAVGLFVVVAVAGPPPHHLFLRPAKHA